MSLRKKSAKGIFWILMEQFGLGGIAFIIDLYLTRLLSPGDFGMIGMILLFIMVGQTLMEGGMITSLIRTKDPDQDDYSTVFIVNAIVGMLLYGILYVCMPLVASFYNQPTLVPIGRVYLLGLVIIAFSVVQQAKMRKEMDFKTHARIQIIAKVLSGLCGVGFAMSGWNVWSLVYMYIVNQSLLAIQFWVFSKWRPVLSFNTERLKHHFKFGYKLTISSLLETIATNVYYLLIGRFFSPLIVGYYLRANQLRLVPVNAVSTALGHVTLPLFATLQNDPAHLRAVYKRIMQQVLFCLSPVLIGAAVLAAPVFELLFTAKWLPAVPYFQILCVIGILYPLHSYNLNILKAIGRSDLFLQLEVIKKSLLVVIILVSLPFGMFGLLVGQVVMSVLSFLINSYHSGKFIRYGAGQQLWDLSHILLLALFMGLCVWTADMFWFSNLTLLPRVLFGIATGLTAYIIPAIVLRLDVYRDFLIFVKDLQERQEYQAPPLEE